MRLKQKHSLRAWTAAILVPLVVLAVLAVVGIRSQRASARARVLDEAASISTSQGRLLSEKLDGAILAFPGFPDPLVPDPEFVKTPLDEILDGTDLEKLRELRDMRDAANTRAGLPRRAVAALRLEYLDAGTQEAADLVALLTEQVPSVLTLPALARLKERYPEHPVPEAWRLLAVRDEMMARQPGGGWFTFEGRPCWLSPDGGSYLPPSAIDLAGLDLPPFASARLSSLEKVVTGPASGEILASAPVEFASPLALDWVLVSPQALAAATRQQSRWTFIMVGASIIVCGVGLCAILRVVREERRLGKLKSDFVSSVSHELRAPLGSIRLMADALESGRVDCPADFHRRIVRETIRVSRLVENVLDFARIEEGNQTYHFEPTDLADLVGQTVDGTLPWAATSGHTIDLALDPGSALVDRSAFQQAVANLTDNALKFSPPGTTVSIALRWSGDGWTLTVADEGPGVPEAERERIFERFYRLGDELRRETKGSGIGLSVVRHVAQAHGGTVRVTNHPTTFTLTCPTTPQIDS